jgi:hypothetical protein
LLLLFSLILAAAQHDSGNDSRLMFSDEIVSCYKDPAELVLFHTTSSAWLEPSPGGERCSLAAARGGVQRRGTSGVELRADGVADALLDEAEQFGFDVVAGELEREFLGALTVTRLREDLVDCAPNSLRGRLVSPQIDPCA